MDGSEGHLLKGLKEGDDNAYRELYKKHYTVLCHVASTYLRDDFLARALVDDVIFHLWEIREELDIKVPVRTYLIRAVKNRCLNYIRQNKALREISSSSGDYDMFPDVSTPLGTLLEKEMEDTIMQIIDNLPPESRKAFKKSRFERRKYTEIAADLAISINTVKYHVKRAIAIISSELEKYL